MVREQPIRILDALFAKRIRIGSERVTRPLLNERGRTTTDDEDEWEQTSEKLHSRGFSTAAANEIC